MPKAFGSSPAVRPRWQFNAADGAVADVQVVECTTADPVLEACVLTAARQVTLASLAPLGDGPGPGAGVRMVYPFVFRSR